MITKNAAQLAAKAVFTARRWARHAGEPKRWISRA